jgi:thiol-disulfide isomerase/thioredoxin
MYSDSMENKKKKRPFLTVKETVIGIAIVVLTAIAFGKPIPIIDLSPPPPPARSVSYEEIANFSRQLKDITAKQVAENISNSGKKSTLMVFYTSWCGYCKRLLPKISKLKKERKIEHVNLLLISVDKERNDASRYILENNYDKIFTPYIISDDEETDLKNIIKNKGGNYTRAIPYSLIFDSNGNLLEENVGINIKMLNSLETVKPL